MRACALRYQPYRAAAGPQAASHKAIGGGWGSNLGAGGGGLGAEFDVPKCGPGVAGCSKSTLDGSWIHTVVGIQRFPGSGTRQLVVRVRMRALRPDRQTSTL